MIVITGASSGLGAALAKRLDADGQTVLLTGRSREKLAAVDAQLSEQSSYQTCDLANHSSVSDLFDGFQDQPTTLIHCAGSGYFGLLEQQEPDAIQALIDNNLKSAINVLQEAVKRYQDNPVNVVMVMSTAAQQPKAQESTYCAVKWAVRGLLESVRLELKGKPMKLIAVYPGGMDTEFWPSSGQEVNTSGFMGAEDVAEMIHSSLSSLGNGFVSDITINRV
ncbi:short-chain dehydrogenase [Vibrio coralliilyticus]|uniref:Short-chain dehydrogenase n=1 Tax=Vibrio coralliilyticus TaxID=190893 RepID=A0A837GD38_9VIBR|nr:SDR family NAD(P)-dependent oxidoreductase [Vibrio coralliilyticus]KJY74440.1 short-chain dehydrogenase [Vibrio coralliilyticus]QOU28705.1 SDR family NAD(P)-dependent oxidoreductase [Vibrio coralliilyticus]